MPFMHRARRAFTSLILLGLLAGGAASAAGYTAQAGRIYDRNGQEVQLRGINHYGFNSGILQPQYLWQMGWKEQIAQIKSLGFNAVRLPFGPDALHVTTPIDKLSYLHPQKNGDLFGKTPQQAMDLWMAEANRQGLYVLLDFHGVSAVRQYPTWFVSNPADYGLMYNKRAYTPADWTRDLAFVAKRYAHLPYFIGIDIYNEPNGIVRWSTGDRNAANPANHWKPAAEAAAAAILKANPDLLVFVEGITANYDGVEDSNLPINWGENLQPQAYQPLNIPLDKLVLAPHTYGPDVYMKSSFKAANFPANLAAHWDKLFGQFSNVHPVVIGEWGGRYGNGAGGQQDVVWQNALVDYMIRRGIRSSFYWCYTPNSWDTGGILDDNLKVREDKMALLRRLWSGATLGAQPAPKPAAPAPAPRPPAAQPAPKPASTIGISSFSPTSGPVGTRVTVNGAGFAKASEAWVGKAHGTPVRVISDSKVEVTIPAAATTGAIGIFAGKQVAFTPVAFTVTRPAGAGASNARPYISSYYPTAGRPGTVVTISGRGLRGVRKAWVGTAKNARIRVMSDTMVQVTVPPGATSGPIAVLGARYAAFSPRFTVR